MQLLVLGEFCEILGPISLWSTTTDAHIHHGIINQLVMNAFTSDITNKPTHETLIVVQDLVDAFSACASRIRTEISLLTSRLCRLCIWKSVISKPVDLVADCALSHAASLGAV